MPRLDVPVTEDDARRAKLRRMIREKLHEEHPVLRLARNAVDAADEITRNVKDERPTVARVARRRERERFADSMNELNAALSEVRSEPTLPPRHPVMADEATFRGTVRTTALEGADLPDSNAASKTIINGATHPMNVGAFNAALRTELAGSKLEPTAAQLQTEHTTLNNDSSDSDGEGKITAAFVVRFKVCPDASNTDVEACVDKFRSAAAAWMREMMEYDDEAAYKLDFTIEGTHSDERQIVMCGTTIDPDADLVGRQLEEMTTEELNIPGLARDTTEMFRRVEFKFESPVSVGDFLGTSNSIALLLNRSRFSVDVHARRAFTRHFHSAFASAAMSGPDFDAAGMFGGSSVVHTARHASADVVLSQPSLVLGQNIRSVSRTFRAAIEASEKIAEMHPDERKEFLSSTVVETMAAQAVTKMQGFGILGEMVPLQVIMMAMTVIADDEDEFGAFAAAMSVNGVVQEVQSATVLSRVMRTDIEFTGFDVFRHMPRGVSAAKDVVKQFVLSVQSEADMDSAVEAGKISTSDDWDEWQEMEEEAMEEKTKVLVDKWRSTTGMRVDAEFPGIAQAIAPRNYVRVVLVADEGKAGAAADLVESWTGRPQPRKLGPYATIMMEDDVEPVVLRSTYFTNGLRIHVMQVAPGEGAAEMCACANAVVLLSDLDEADMEVAFSGPVVRLDGAKMSEGLKADRVFDLGAGESTAIIGMIMANLDDAVADAAAKEPNALDF